MLHTTGLASPPDSSQSIVPRNFASVDHFPAIPPVVTFTGPVVGSGRTLLRRKSIPGLDNVQLKCCGFVQLSTCGLPSYVPDWTQPKYGGGILQRYYRFKPTHLFRASGKTKPHVVVADDGSDGISVEGLRLDTISRVIDIKSLLVRGPVSSTTVTESVLHELAENTIPTGTYSFTVEPAWMANFRTLTADRTALSPRIGDGYRSANFSRFSDVDLQKPNHIPTGLPGSLWEEVSKAVEVIVEDKDLFVTEKGYVGLGHETCAAGDVVCIFFGGEVPFLVRPDGGADGHGFRFLGECYVHGIMDGEAMDGRGALEKFLLL
ncbi:hypothetical protein NW759_016334 [Fusarium solani]|nr:hypothetical protein NW759_016334 [Fusarium solani]